MRSNLGSNQETLVTVFGGSGFLGRNVVRALAKRGYRVRVAVRRPELAGHLQPLGRVGQIHAVQANVRYPASVEAAMRDASVAVNLIGILTEGGAQSFDAVQAKGAETIAKAAHAVGARMVHVSAIGADANSPSAYGRTKAAGEQAVLAAVPSATIMRPSLLFGPEDQFTNRFAALARISPFLPLIGGGTTRMQPAYVGDVATAVADAVDGKTKPGGVYELGGPEVLTMREIMEIILEHHRAQAHAGFAAVGPGEIPGDVPAVRAGRAEADAGPGDDAAVRQRGVRRRQGRRPDVRGARHRAGFDGSDRPAISLALPRCRAIPAQERVSRIFRAPDAAQRASDVLQSRGPPSGERPGSRLCGAACRTLHRVRDKKETTSPAPARSGRRRRG